MNPLLYLFERLWGKKGSALQLIATAPVAALLPLLVSCAGQVAPSGGPPDRVPPAIVRTTPDTNAVRVSTNEIVLEFDKYVDRRTVEESIFISPYLGDLEFAWSGREVTVMFTRPLRPRTTYVVNVGTDVVDLRERNRMSSGFTLAFSTGDSIDQGSIAGQVYDDRPEGVMIFAYQLDQIDKDTLNPASAKPDFIMQSGQQGRFRLSNLPLGLFRLFAVRDEYRNLVYDREVDQIGMASTDVALRLEGPHVDGIPFRLSKEDTTRPFVTGAVALHRQEVDVRLNESLDSTRLDNTGASVSDTTGGGEVPVLATYWKHTQPPTLGVILGVPLDSSGIYRVRVRGAFDRAGNPLNPENAGATFEGTGRRDTTLVHLSISGIRDSTRGVLPEAALELEFSEPVLREPLKKGIQLLDSVGRPTGFGYRWEGAARVAIQPQHPLWPSAWYALAVRLDSVLDLRGRRYVDSLWRVRFQTLDLKKTGEIAGSVGDARGGKAGYVVSAESIDRSERQTRTTRLERAGPFVLGRVTEGKYAISGFEDSDGDGKYSFGTPFPFHPAERYAVAADTVRVRARWGIEGVLLRFK
jgi:hypothetical protein